MEKSKLVDGLIANADTSWDESNRDELLAMGDNILAKIVANSVKKEVTTEVTNEDAEAIAKAKAEAKLAGTEEVVVNTAKMSVDEYLKNHVPAALRPTLQAAMNTERTLKLSIVNKLVANDFCTFTEEFLMTKDLEELQNLQMLANSNAPQEPEGDQPDFLRFHNFSGQGGQQNQQNQQFDEKPLGMPEATAAAV